MPFWSTQTLRAKIPAQQIIEPYDSGRVVHSAYEMGVGSEAFITSNPGDKTEIPTGVKIVIPPGQFGLLVTQEIVKIPDKVLAFISIRAGIKFQGLVNVSGFHVDPGYHGRLKFAVYNAGAKSIVLDQGQRVFMIWLADLDAVDNEPYPDRQISPIAITSDDVMRIQGEIASPAELKKLIDELKSDLEKKIHAVEQTKLYNRSLVTFLIGLVGSIGVAILIWVFIKPTFERNPNPPNTSPPTLPTASRPVEDYPESTNLDAR